MFENEPRLFARNTGKPREELRELCAILQILKQRGDGNARIAEYPCATDTLGIPLDGRTGRPINHVAILGSWAAPYNMPDVAGRGGRRGEMSVNR